jgi:hypothetical protein
MGIKGPTDKSDWLKCPFRVIQPSLTQGDTQEDTKGMICEAGGGTLLLPPGKAGETVPLVCLTCDIPEAITEDYACLYLIPFRIFEGDEAQSYYACQWFLTLNPQKVPKDTVWCRGCPYWFPRPDEFLITNRIRLSHKALQFFLFPPEPKISPRSADSKEDKRNRWYERIWNALP